MLEQIAQLVKQYGQETVVNNPAIPNDQNNEVMAEATHTITGGMQNMLAGGGLQDIISMFTNKGNTTTGGNSGGGIASLMQNPAVAAMITQFIGKLTTKFNMSPAQATQVSNNLIPNVLQDVVTKTTSTAPEHEGFNLNSLIGQLTGGKAAGGDGTNGGFDFQGLLNQVSSGKSTDGGTSQFDLQDIISKVTNSAKQNQEQQAEKGEGDSSGGIGNLIKGLFN